MLLAIPFEEGKIIDPEKHAREELRKAGKLKKKPVVQDKAANFVQNATRDKKLSHAERHLINLQAQEYDQLKIMDEFHKMHPSMNAL